MGPEPGSKLLAMRLGCKSGSLQADLRNRAAHRPGKGPLAPPVLLPHAGRPLHIGLWGSHPLKTTISSPASQPAMTWAWRAAPPPAAAGTARHGRQPALRPQASAPGGSASTSSSDPGTADSSSIGKRQHTPLLQAVEQRGNRLHEVPFHVPGHKRGSSTPPGLQRLLGSSLQYDLTELDGEIAQIMLLCGMACCSQLEGITGTSTSRHACLRTCSQR